MRHCCSTVLESLSLAASSQSEDSAFSVRCWALRLRCRGLSSPKLWPHPTTDPTSKMCICRSGFSLREYCIAQTPKAISNGWKTTSTALFPSKKKNVMRQRRAHEIKEVSVPETSFCVSRSRDDNILFAVDKCVLRILHLAKFRLELLVVELANSERQKIEHGQGDLQPKCLQELVRSLFLESYQAHYNYEVSAHACSERHAVRWKSRGLLAQSTAAVSKIKIQRTRLD